MRALLLFTAMLVLLAQSVLAAHHRAPISVAVALIAADVAHDPYAIMTAHYQATGGLQRWKQLTTSYATGRVIYDGLSGTFKSWERDPLQSRLEEDFGIIRQVQGDNGVNAWRLDYNGQLELVRDPETLKRRELARLLSNFEHLNRQSRVFSLTLEGREQFNGHPCYVVRMENTLNTDITRYYVSVENLLMLASTTRQPDIAISSSYRDYRRIDGFLIAFHQSDDISPRQKHRETQLTSLVLNPDLDDAIFEVPQAQPPAIKFPSGQQQVTIPIMLVEGAIYIRVTIDNSCGWWLLDSGASNSVIDAGYARSLNLSPSGWIKGFGYGDNFDLSLVQLPGLSVGSKTEELHMAAHVVMSYAGLSDASYEPCLCGILGYDFISRFVVRIDYGHQYLTLHHPDWLPDSAPHEWVDAPLKYHMFTVPVCVDDTYCGRWSLDLGAERSSINAPYIQRHHALQDQRARGVEHVNKGLVSHSIDKLARFTSLEVGGWKLDRPVISLSAPVTVGSATMGELVGNLGASQLQNFILWLDYPQQRVAFEAGVLFGNSEQLDKSGMLVGMSYTQQPMISFVAADSPAQRCGFVAGDLIIAIDGQSVDLYGGVRKIRQLLRQSAGCCYEFRLQRGQDFQVITLCLENLL